MARQVKNNEKCKGDVLITEKPFAFALKGSLSSERCDDCFKK